jgi:NapC/NirT cytochrome c family, N-terminal region
VWHATTINFTKQLQGVHLKSLTTVPKGMALLAALFLLTAANAATVAPAKSKTDTQIGKICVGCHQQQSPGIVAEWKKSAHATQKVDCYDCHQGRNGDKGVISHAADASGNSIYITAIVSPKACARCHANEVAQQERSHHAKAGQILASLDNIMGEVIGGPAAVTPRTRPGPTRESAGSIPMEVSGLARPAMHGIAFRRRRRERRTPAASATLVRIIRKLKSITNPSTASCTGRTSAK